MSLVDRLVCVCVSLVVRSVVSVFLSFDVMIHNSRHETHFMREGLSGTLVVFVFNVV